MRFSFTDSTREAIESRITFSTGCADATATGLLASRAFRAMTSVLRATTSFGPSELRRGRSMAKQLMRWTDTVAANADDGGAESKRKRMQWSLFCVFGDEVMADVGENKQ